MFGGIAEGKVNINRKLILLSHAAATSGRPTADATAGFEELPDLVQLQADGRVKPSHDDQGCD
jgi:hypothetical protein